MKKPTKLKLFLKWLKYSFCFHKWEYGDPMIREARGYYWYQICVKCGKERFE